ANRGIRVSANNTGGGPNHAVIFDSSNPSGGDWDLGTPNSDFGGPGLGVGGRLGQPGANNVPLGKLLIVQENYTPRNCGPGNNDYCNPDDEAGGGALIFDFDCPTTIQDVTIVDADDGNPSGAVLTFNGGAAFAQIPNLGNNSTQTVYINQAGVNHMEVVFAGSGGLAAFHYQPDTAIICIEQGTLDIDSMLNLPVYSLGLCNNPCTASNPGISAPPACVSLIMRVTTDNFASESSWRVLDMTTGLTVGSRQFTFLDNAQVFSDTLCVDPRHCFAATMFDSFGDGMCCNNGNGTWSVKFDTAAIVVSPLAGAFAGSETVQVGVCAPNKDEEASSPAAAMDDLVTELMVSAYPNPSNGRTTIKFLSPKAGRVQLDLFTMTGVQVKTLYNGVVNAGVSQQVEFETQAMPAGIYLYRLTSEAGVKAGKLQVVH
ncbi:MAG TPA: T9SS type A sorting domain-containing protein, partial [Bacteroidetes bacterium]|nr:T9SS type A sorting domain-containing protein [Bacteroidota bacterium]